MNFSEIQYLDRLPPRNSFPSESVLFFDGVLQQNPVIRQWIKNFRFALKLTSGEQLKSIRSLESVLQRLNRLKIAQTTELTFISFGGGSVGDFVGFLSSIYRRGCNLIHIPSTWLAAIDSSHGGKTALNFNHQKNQLGTFYPASKIQIVSSLLKTQPQQRITEVMGEVLKMAVIEKNGKTFKKLESQRNHVNEDLVLSLLPNLVKQKYKIVKRDPYEKQGFRRVLNLGHTLGHIFEISCGLPHGLAVLLGLGFSARWSYHLGYCSLTTMNRITIWEEQLIPAQARLKILRALNRRKVMNALNHDKKRTTDSHLDFIYVRKIGSVFRRSISIVGILNEFERQQSLLLTKASHVSF